RRCRRRGRGRRIARRGIGRPTAGDEEKERTGQKLSFHRPRRIVHLSTSSTPTPTQVSHFATDSDSVVLTLFRNADLFDPERRGQKDVLVAGGSIVAIAPALGQTSLPGCTVVDLGRARLVPGLIDAHVHLTGGGGES